jgi:hypothetical protein
MNNERFNIEEFEYCLKQKNKSYPEDCKYVLNDGTIIIQSEMSEDYRVDIVPKAPELIKKVKLFYLETGIIKEEFETYIGGFAGDYGIVKYYDKDGNLTKTIDENIKYKDLNVKFLDLLEILKKEPLLDNLSEDEKKHFNIIFNLGKDFEKVVLNDIFKFLSRDKFLEPNNVDRKVLKKEDRFLITLYFDEEKSIWNVTKELYPFGQISLQVNAISGQVFGKKYHPEKGH